MIKGRPSVPLAALAALANRRHGTQRSAVQTNGSPGDKNLWIEAAGIHALFLFWGF